MNPADAAVIRQVAQFTAGSQFALAFDPLSGDLFASGLDGILRISNYASGPGTVTRYTSGDFDGIVFAPDGTLYAAAERQGTIYRFNGTNSPNPGAATAIAFIPGNPDGMALEPNAANAAKPILFVNRNDGKLAGSANWKLSVAGSTSKARIGKHLNKRAGGSEFTLKLFGASSIRCQEA